MATHMAPLTLLIGGARSGKSALATRLATAHQGPVTIVATAAPGDEEMAARIERHQRERPRSWTTIEEAHDLDRAIGSVPSDSTVIVDCLTIWVSNVLDRPDDEVLAAADRSVVAAARHGAPVIAVTNEVGAGIIPDNAATRRYRDLLGEVNRRWADDSDRVLLLSAGHVTVLRPPDEVLDELA